MEMKQNVNARGVKHAISDTGVNLLSGVAIGAGFKSVYVGTAIGVGIIIGTQIRINQSESNFSGETIRLNHQYEKFSVGSSGTKTVLRTLRDKVGGHE